MSNWQDRQNALLESLSARILVLDGAMGTMLQQNNPTIADWGGPAFENCSENLLFTHPEWIKAVHRAYAKRALVKIPSLEEYETQEPKPIPALIRVR